MVSITLESSIIESTWQAITRDAFGAEGAPSFHVPGDIGSRGVIILDQDSRIIQTNAGIGLLLGVPHENLLGRDGRTAVADILENRLKDPGGYRSRCRWLEEHLEEVAEDVLEIVSPERRVLHRYSAPLLDGEGRFSGRVEIYSDITRRRELEKSVQRAYDELKAAQEQLVQSEKLRAIGEVASGVAHDFNNTLGIILGNIQLLMRMVDDESVRSKLQYAERAALDGVETVRRIQEFTKTRAQQPPDVLDLSELAAEVARMMEPVWRDASESQDRKIELRLNLTPGVFALGTGAEAREVFANILMNAVQAMPEGGEIQISTGRSEDSAWLKIADTGVGMTEDVRRSVFDPFFTTRGVEGTGLGMSVAYGIVKRHGGTISIESEPGKGTAVTVTLPSANDLSQDGSGLPRQEHVSVDPARILVVDDEEMFAQVFVEMLSEFGHSVCVARNGADALEQFDRDRFDLVFTDLRMPEMSGWQLAETIKNIDPAVPVVLLTGWGAVVDDSDIEASGVDMVLAKPVKLEKLSSIVAEALGRRADGTRN